MEFNFIINKLIPLDSQGIGIYESKPGRNKTMTTQEQQVSQLINTMGEKSAVAQGLKQVITHYDKIQGTNQRLYVAAEGRVCQGILKVGQKNLFYRDLTGSVKEIKPLCVLDFYVHETCQRQGFGKLLFEYMLMHENITTEKLAYDRPSPKLIAFLKRHYNLSKYIAQNNNFVVFDQYFKPAPHSMQQNSQNQANSRSYSQQLGDPYPSNIPSYPTQQQQQILNQRGHPYKQESPSEAMLHSASRNNKENNIAIIFMHNKQKEFVNAGRAILSKDEGYKIDNKNQQNIENTIKNSEYSMKNQQSYGKDQYNNNVFENQWGDKSAKKPPIQMHKDRQLDKIQLKIQQTEKELAQVNQQIIRQRHNLSQDPLTQNHHAQNIYNTNSQATSPWANTGFNVTQFDDKAILTLYFNLQQYYSTSSSNYGNHYTYYKK